MPIVSKSLSRNLVRIQAGVVDEVFITLKIVKLIDTEVLSDCVDFASAAVYLHPKRWILQEMAHKCVCDTTNFRLSPVRHKVTVARHRSLSGEENVKLQFSIKLILYLPLHGNRLRPLYLFISESNLNISTQLANNFQRYHNCVLFILKFIWWRQHPPNSCVTRLAMKSFLYRT